ncbi:hypothetical protein [Streptomyces sp. SID3343]|uniref:hypothetical protein n=1 Tax=Streptomyces sp. SID3343 TaxID=2690260 RepID=UPI001371F676|nr:hypothetical protein [Streptomyces sp. SID3343]MYW03898.1 hypothetical protein [Streptomyces sp. SID3343]
MTDALNDLLWHTGTDLGTALIERLGAPPPTSPPQPVPAPLAAYRLRNGIPDGLVGRPPALGRPGTAGDPASVLDLLERDDPAINAVLFKTTDWPALRRAILGQYSFARGITPQPDEAAPRIALDPELRSGMLSTLDVSRLEAALWAHDPDLVFWALLAHTPRDPLATLAALVTLKRTQRFAQLRTVLRRTDHRLPHDLTPLLRMELSGGHLDRLPTYLAEALDPALLVGRIRATRRVSRAHAMLRTVLVPDWRTFAEAHEADPLPWTAVAALAEHPRCPDDLLDRFADRHPQVLEFVPAPSPALLERCVTEGTDKYTKQVLTRRLATGRPDLSELLDVRSARLLLTALDQGSIHAAATQADVALGLGRVLREHLDLHGPALWSGLYATLPVLDVSVLDLFAAAARHTEDPPTRPGRQAAWAYTVLIDLAGESAAQGALTGLDDEHLAPLAGTPTLPGFLAARLAAAAGPITARVLAGNPATPRAVLTELATRSDPAVGAAVYRNPHATDAARRTVLAAPTLDPDLRRELLTTDDPVRLRTLTASADPELLARAVRLDDTPKLRALRLHAALRLAETTGIAALTPLRREPVIATAVAGRALWPLRDAIRELNRRHTTALLAVPHYQHTSYDGDTEVAAAVHDPAPDWPALIAALRAGKLALSVGRELADRPDVPEEFAEALALRPYSAHAARGWGSRHHAFVHDDEQSCLHRPNAADLLDTGALTLEVYVDRAPAVDVLAAAVSRPRLGRLVARLLRERLGDDTDAWVIAARLAAEGSRVSLPLLTATATAASGT